MRTDLTTLTTRFARRPLLMLPSAAHELAMRIRTVDPRAFAQPGRFEAFMRKVGLAGNGQRPMAMDDDDYVEIPLEEKLAYAPLWLGEPDDSGYCWTLKGNIALMQVDTPLVERGEEFCGVVYHGYDTLLQGMREALADDRVKALFIRDACPGGVVAGGLEACANFMRQAREAAGGKPIWIYADMACSAAYWIAAQADRILAPNVGLIGSIGAVLVHEDYSGAYAKEGVKVTPIQFGAKKTDGAYWAPLSDGAKADLQAEIDQCGRNFVAAVVAGRPSFTAEALLATEAGVFMGDHDEPGRSALKLGFIDALSSEEDAFAELAEHVSPTRSALPAKSAPSAAATGGRGAVKTSKEEPMAVTGPKNTAAAAARTAEKAKLEADTAKATARLAEIQAEEQAEAATTDEMADEAEDAADGGADEAAEGETDETSGDKKPDATAIAASAEAKSHPQLALAAIQSGMTLAQFKASVEAAGKQASGGALDRHMAGSRRLGPDTPAPDAAAAADKLNPGAIFGRRAEQARGVKSK